MTEPHKAVTFLKLIQPQGPWCLCSQDVAKERPFTGKRFKPDESEACAEWIAARNAERQQIWYRAAAIRAGVEPAYAKDSDVYGVYFVWIDLDPIKVNGAYEDRERDRARIREMLTSKLPADVPAPSWIVD